MVDGDVGARRKKMYSDETLQYNDPMISFFIFKKVKWVKTTQHSCLSFALHTCVLHHVETFHFLFFSPSSHPTSIYTSTWDIHKHVCPRVLTWTKEPSWWWISREGGNGGRRDFGGKVAVFQNFLLLHCILCRVWCVM